MVIITDGDATDSDQGSVKAAKEKKILRFIIGIGSSFPKNVSQAKIMSIASEPKDTFVKVLKRFEELKDSFNELQAKIYDIEGVMLGLHTAWSVMRGGDSQGTSDRDNRSFQLEMSSSGFSADISQQGGLTGEKFITAPTAKEEMKAAYLGYTLKFLQRQKREFYAVGAPRYQHVGRVLVFEVTPSPANWTLKQQIPGEQVGSYFGAVLCSVDVDSDRETDLLLIGAQLYFKDMRGGRVYVYSWAEDNLALLGELLGDSEYPLGRFGAAIADLADINGDGLTDVAVGAPLEDGESGVVYIYNGYGKTVHMRYSQKIKGVNISPGLKFFGQSIHGKTDLSQDGLTDITVGALGKAVVLRLDTGPLTEIPLRTTVGKMTQCDANLRLHFDSSGHPIFREHTIALIELWFDVLQNSSWGDNVDMEAHVSSDNEKNDTLPDNRDTLRIPVQYPINIIVKGLETSVQYINFSSAQQENKTVTHFYEVKNMPWGPFPPAAVTVFVKVPTVFTAGLKWEVDSVRAEPSVICRLVQMDNSSGKTNSVKDHPQLIECAVDQYHTYQCNLGQINSSVISVTGMVYASSKIEEFSQSSFCTASWLTFDTRRYSNQYGSQYAQSQVTTEVDMIYVMNYLPIIIGSALGGLFLLILIIVGLYKCGFFKRNYKDKLDHEGHREDDDEEKEVPLNGEAESK
uniref:Uncharacterized protein n=1 Tax=Sphaerodactylus townsendi TaxID=933632 RepID=A0ACB8EVM2_9SAUR